jgi:hypothetical protein
MAAYLTASPLTYGHPVIRGSGSMLLHEKNS